MHCGTCDSPKISLRRTRLFPQTAQASTPSPSTAMRIRLANASGSPRPITGMLNHQFRLIPARMKIPHRSPRRRRLIFPREFIGLRGPGTSNRPLLLMRNGPAGRFQSCLCITQIRGCVAVVFRQQLSPDGVKFIKDRVACHRYRLQETRWVCRSASQSM
jgi:hypothetical protein